ncbi:MULTISPECIES: DNA polymerase III subunit delta [Thermomonospora]|uniref:DNA-directed DNA polymerase n=1 Tax=Thermomonospora cellulosilytica TaxID=1411118 RepID=A0A7W3N3Q0_9ACTN|nr:MULTISPECIES: DNA polymerase III subunit delta [Thermomonospora]MBA9006918.1 DNA polymerase-3 subunit delta [Thermomonospora cellulosilytica]
MPADALTLIVGDEELLAERAVGEVVAAARAEDPETEVIELEPGSLEPGRLAELTSPSLFGGGKVLVLRSAQDLGKELIAEVVAYAKRPADDVALVALHPGGAKGKALVDGLTKAGARKVVCSKITKVAERVAFVRAEVRRCGGTIGEDAARNLIEAVGSDLRELAGACSQLVADTGGKIDDGAVARYYRGRAEVSGFTVADKAVEGRLAEALEQLRWALVTGTPPVLIVSALAQGVRGLAKVGGAPRGARGAGLAKELGMPPWKIERLQRQLRGWSADGVAQALSVVAEADAQVKGGATDPAYALEKAIAQIVAARGSR